MTLVSSLCCSNVICPSSFIFRSRESASAMCPSLMRPCRRMSAAGDLSVGRRVGQGRCVRPAPKRPPLENDIYDHLYIVIYMTDPETGKERR
jgi:hypothetical protein